jgi:glycerophosphoryl diester phosphodiesterase
VILKSFQDRVVSSIKEHNPDAIAGLLLDVGSSMRRRHRGSGLRVTTRLERCRADFVGPHYRLATRRFIERMQKRNMPVLVWTVDNEKRAARLAVYGVQGIITNVPDNIARVIRGK